MSKNYPELKLYIDGEWLPVDHRMALEVLSPSTEVVLGRLPCADNKDVDRAIAAAAKAFETWRQVSPLTRADILAKVVNYLQANRHDIAHVITLELGKPIQEAYAEVDGAGQHFRWAAEETRRLYGRVIPARDTQTIQTVISEPIGPIAAFSGWNAPAITPSRKIAAALAAGCTIVLKPAEETPATAMLLAKALEDSGLPNGVLNIVFGEPAKISEQLLASEHIKAVTFTGSTAIGKSIATQASTSLKRMVLELGGHAPAIVFADADPEEAAYKLAQSKYRNAGQICTSPTRIQVHTSIAERFYAAFSDYAKNLNVGDGMDKSVKMGPLANSRRRDAIEVMVSDALSKNGRLLAGGSRIGSTGYYFQPTVISGFDASWLSANVEPFGPLAILRTFDDNNNALAEANRLPFGLAAYIFTNDARLIRTMTASIASGVVCVNHCLHSLPESPFGGYGDSGMGKEGGIEGISAFLQYKYITQM